MSDDRKLMLALGASVALHIFFLALLPVLSRVEAATFKPPEPTPAPLELTPVAARAACANDAGPHARARAAARAGRICRRLARAKTHAASARNHDADAHAARAFAAHTGAGSSQNRACAAGLSTASRADAHSRLD